MASKYRRSAFPTGGAHIIGVIVFILVAALASLCIALISENPARIRGAISWLVLASILCGLLWTRQNWARQLFAGLLWIVGTLASAMAGMGLIMTWQDSGSGWNQKELAACAIFAGIGLSSLIVASILTTNRAVQAFFQPAPALSDKPPTGEA